MQRSKVSEKNTKQELLAAYHELLTESGEKPARLPERDPALVNVDELGQAALKPLSELKLSLSQQLDRIGSEFLRGIEAVREVQQTAAKERVRLAERHQEQQLLLDRELTAVRQAWQREQTKRALGLKEQDEQRELERTREEEAYRYERSIGERNDRDAFERAKAERERSIGERETALKDRQQAIKTMEQELEEVPKRIEVAVKAAEAALATQLTTDHDRALHDHELMANHAATLHQAAIATLEASTKRQADEIEQLKSQLATANQQLKEIAVAVIEGRKATAEPSDRDRPEAR
jgi:hypothetical protein